MATTFNEDNTIEQMIISTLKNNGWKYIPAEELPRMHSDVLVEPMVKEALIRLNPEIAEDPSRADEVIYKLRTVILSVQPHNLVTQNEVFKKMIFEENSYPFGKDGRMVPIRFFGTMRKEDLALNEYVVTNQWVYPQAEGGKRLDIVLLINGFPIAVGELKTPVRSAITWLDAAGDISAYEKSIPAMFVTNVFNFATEGKFFEKIFVNTTNQVFFFSKYLVTDLVDLIHDFFDIIRSKVAGSEGSLNETPLELFTACCNAVQSIVESDIQLRCRSIDDSRPACFHGQIICSVCKSSVNKECIKYIFIVGIKSLRNQIFTQFRHAVFKFFSDKAQEYKCEHHITLFKKRSGISCGAQNIAALKKDCIKIDFFFFYCFLCHNDFSSYFIKRVRMLLSAYQLPFRDSWCGT